MQSSETTWAVTTLQILYFFVPAYLANMAPVLIGNRLGSLAVPLDFGASIAGTRIFGGHKTWRGLLVGTITGAIVFLLQRVVHSAGLAHELALFDYATLAPSTGVLLGFGALAGDAVKSFFKRRVGIAPGHPWIGPDEIDFYLGAWACTVCAAPIPLVPMLLSIPIVFVGDMLTNLAAWRLGLKASWI